jgi:superfamily I DNA/RNA helicase
MKVRKIIANEKAKHSIEVVENILEQGKKVIIFTNFTDTLNLIYEHFKKQAVYLDGSCSKKARQEAVDEFQDNDPVQDELLSQWLGKRNSICVVGDPRQTIYSFKGSEPELLNNFGTRFPKCVTVELIRNYRSTPQIVAWANRLMHEQSASGGAKSDLISNQAQGPQPIIMSADSESAEHKLVAEKVQALIANTKTLNSQIAILLRINASISIYHFHRY